MQVSVENVGKLERKLTVRIPADKLDAQVSERIAKMGRTVRLKGFRPGKVPSKVIQQRYGEQIRREALSELIGDSYRHAVEQEKLQPVANPSIDTTGRAEDGEIAYTATFEVLPEFPDIEVGELEIEKPVAEIAESDIDTMIETLRKQRRTFEAVDRAAQDGDMVLFEYSAQASDFRFPEDGVERAGTVLGSNAMSADLEKALIGHKAGEELEIDAAFPKDHRESGLAGKLARVNARVMRVQAPKLPELDGEFAKTFGIRDGDMGTFRDEVRANLQRELDNALMGWLKSDVASRLVERHSDLDVPRVMIEAEARGMARVKEGEQLAPERMAQLEPQARQRVIAALLLGEIARQNELSVDDKRVGRALAQLASTYEEPEKVIELYSNDPQLMSGLRNRVLEDQVAEWVAEHAKPQEKHLSFDEVMHPARAG